MEQTLGKILAISSDRWMCAKMPYSLIVHMAFDVQTNDTGESSPLF